MMRFIFIRVVFDAFAAGTSGPDRKITKIQGKSQIHSLAGIDDAVEYAREFEEACNVDDDELTAFDYERLILSKFSQNEHAIASHANHGIVFS